MIRNLRFDCIDKINLIPVVGSFSSLTLIFLKTVKCPITRLSSHTFKELTITTIPVIGTIYLLFFRSYPQKIASEIKQTKPIVQPIPLNIPGQKPPMSTIQEESGVLDTSFTSAVSGGSPTSTPIRKLPQSPTGSLPGTEQMSRVQSRLATPTLSRQHSPEAGFPLPIDLLQSRKI